MTLMGILNIIRDIKFNNWDFHLATDGEHDERVYLQVRFWAPSNINGGEPELQRGRKWYLSQHMTKSEIVQTALKAVLTAIEHEAREQFLYKDKAIFGPHFDVDALHEICGKEDRRK